MYGFQTDIRAIVIGASGGLGNSFVEQMKHSERCRSIWSGARSPEKLTASPKVTTFFVDITQEDSIEALAQQVKEQDYQPNLIINCCGILHNAEGIAPEKTWRHLNLELMTKVFSINAFGMGLLAKHLIPCMPRRGRAVFASVSARVGSISDNHLGGWYSYRASKAAHNMLMKTIAIEANRKRRDIICVSLHPGTVTTNLSAPFTKRKDPAKLFSPQQSTTYLEQVLSGLTPADSGNLFAWDGQAIPF